MTISWKGLTQQTPVAVHIVSLVLLGWGTYGEMINEFINAAPIDVPEFKAQLIAWLNWLCPAIGLIMQFIHKNATQEG